MSTAAARPTDPRFQSAIEQYAAAMKYFSQQKFDRARPLLEKVRDCGYPELVERASLHLNTCAARLDGPAATPKSADECYLHAVIRLNAGQYDAAEELLTRAQRNGGVGPHYSYVLACLRAQTNDPEAALTHLIEAVRSDGRYRVLARQDPDLAGLIDDPRFTEILYPESRD